MILRYAHTERTLGQILEVLDGLSVRRVAHFRCEPGQPCVLVEIADERHEADVRKRLHIAGLSLA